MLAGTFPSVRPTKCGSLPTPSQQHVCRRPQRQASITCSDEVPQVKVENRKTAPPFARARVRAYQSVSVFCLHLFTHMPQNIDSQINRGEGFVKSLHILPISRGFFFDNPLFSNALSLITEKKMGNSINVCDRRNHCAVCFFRARVRPAPQRTNLSFTTGYEVHFLPVGAHLNMAAGANFYLETG